MTFDSFAGQIFAENSWRTATSAGRQERLDPATLGAVGRIALVEREEVEAVVARANAAQRDWTRVDAKTRALLLHRVARSIQDDSHHDVAELMSREMGKPWGEALGEIANVAPVFRYMAELARDEAGKVAGTTQAGSFQFARYEPYGVSVHIMPFNFPILLMCWTVAASLAAGNAVIVKPAEPTTLSTLAFMKHFSCLPPGLVSCLPGGGATGQALIESKGTHLVAFTGGVEIGRRVAVACAERFKPCLIEAGGNDAMIVMDSAPLEVAAAGAVCAAFHLSGQVCTSAERLFVHERIHDAFLEEFARRTRALRIGNGLERTEIGPLVSQAARDRIAALVEEAVRQGARVVTGGRVPPGHNTGWFYEPTILADCRPDMALFKGESFGPVAAVVKVRDLEEALALANASDYGLGGSIFTTRMDEAHRAIEAFECGMVWVNNPLIDNDALPFGGWKHSGQGRELGRQGLEFFRRPKMVILDPVPALQSWWYPYGEAMFHPKARR